MPDAQSRGSEKLIGERIGRSETISIEALRELVEVSRKHGVMILDWHQFGQPAIDGVLGTFQVSPEVAGNLLVDVLKLHPQLPLKWEVFPYGIINPDILLMNFRSLGKQ